MRNDHTILEGYYFGDDQEALEEAMMADNAFVQDEEIEENEEAVETEEIKIVSRRQANKVPNAPRFHMLSGGKK